MTKEDDFVTEEDLLAFADGQLDPGRQRAVEAFLEANPDRARQVCEWQKQNEAIRVLYGHVADEPIPERLLNVFKRRPVSWKFALRRAAAVLAIAGAGAATGWFGHIYATAPSASTAQMINQAMTAYRVYAAEVRHPVEVAANDEAHLVAWLSKRIGQKLVAPNLTKAGFQLVGGRLLAMVGEPTAFLMYEDASGQRITLYVTRSTLHKLAAFRYKSQGGLNGFFWQDERLQYAIIGPVKRAVLNRLAILAYEQLA